MVVRIFFTCATEVLGFYNMTLVLQSGGFLFISRFDTVDFLVFQIYFMCVFEVFSYCALPHGMLLLILVSFCLHA